MHARVVDFARRQRIFWILLAPALGTVLGCSRGTSQTKPQDSLMIFAATSLRDVFTAMADDFRHEHAGVKVMFNFGGTQELRTQIEQGAVADVFASADQRHMDEMVRTRRCADPIVFARNEPVIVVANESVGTIKALADLPNAKRIVIGAAEVPIGRYTLQILDRASKTDLGANFRARVEAKVASHEMNVRQVLAKVSLGEADAGVVYRTDVTKKSDGIGVVTIPAEINVIAQYPVAVISSTPRPQLARAWVDFVLSPVGQRALKKAGFLPPSDAGTSP